MKTSKLRKLAWVFFALVLGTTTAFAQGYGYRNRVNATSDVKLCVEQLSGLSDQQVEGILGLEESHQEKMEVLREQRRSTIDIEEKNSIRNQMLEAKVDHQNEVKALLNPDQQKQFDMIKAGGGQHKYMQTGNRQGNGNRGNGVRQGRGNGNRGNGFSQGNRNGNYNQCARNVRGNGNRGRGNVVNNCRSSRRGNQNFNY